MVYLVETAYDDESWMLQLTTYSLAMALTYQTMHEYRRGEPTRIRSAHYVTDIREPRIGHKEPDRMTGSVGVYVGQHLIPVTTLPALSSLQLPMPIIQGE